MSRGLNYDPVERAGAVWREQGWGDTAAGMAAVVSIMRADQIFMDQATAILRPLDLTFARYQVLGMLRFQGPLTLGKLGDNLWITPATVTNSVDRLEAAGLCRRVDHPEDARATLAEITPKGRKVFDRAVDELNVKLFGAVGLNEDELDQLVQLVRKIRAGAGDHIGRDQATGH